MKRVITEVSHRPSLAFVLVLVIGGLIIGAFAFAGISIRGQLDSRAEATARNCKSSNDARTALRDVFALMEKVAAEGNPDSTPAEKQRAARFFDSVYERLEPIDCGKLP